ncbi:Golgi-associated RAB2 interactor protein 5B isoform X2 [Phascolarctos cinereus]
MTLPVSSPAILREGLFLNDVEHSFQPWVPLLGHLQRTVMEGEYLPLGPLLPMFESNFLQVTNRGEAIFLHKKENPVTMGVASSIPGLLLPDLILLARPVRNRRQKALELTRLLPTHLARLFVHNGACWRLKLRLASGRSFYLQLDANWREGCLLFNRWRYLVYLLQGSAPALALQAPKDHPKDKSQRRSPADSTTLKAKEKMSRAVNGTSPFMTQPEPPAWKRKEKKPDHRHAKMDPPGTRVQEGRSTVTIWTLFSTISSILNQPKASETSTPKTSSSWPSRIRPPVVPHQTSSSWLGSRRQSEKISHTSASSSTRLLGSQSQTGFTPTWKNIHPCLRTCFKSPKIFSDALAWANPLSYAPAQLQPQHTQHEVPLKTARPDKSLRKDASNSHS